MQPLLLPTKVFFEKGQTENEGVFTVEPCEAGYGTTLGNALRRVLLSSLPGAAVTDVKIKGAEHEFSTLEHVQEDVVQIILNAKQIRLKVFTNEPVRLTIDVRGERAVTAGDIAKNADVEIINPDQHIATLTDKKTEFSMELIASAGRGYDAIESRERGASEIGMLAIDAIYTPMRNVGFRVEHVRVGQMTNYDKLVMTIETDGTMNAESAVAQASKMLIDHFSLFLAPRQGNTEPEERGEEGEERAADADVEEESKDA